MSITSHPVQTESAGQLGKVKADARSYTDPDTQVKADQWNQAMARLIEAHREIGLTDGSESGTINGRQPGGPLIDITDDFIDVVSGSGWFLIPNNTGSAAIGASGSPFGFRSTGCASMLVATSGDNATLIKAGCGLTLGAGAPIIETYKFAKAFSTSAFPLVPADTQCSYSLGVGALDSNGAPTDGEFLEARWAGGVRTFWLSTYKATVKTSVSATMPAGTIYAARITVTETGATLEVSVDGGAFALLATSAVAPTQLTYVPVMGLGTDTGGTGMRILFVDSVRTQGTRTAADSGTPSQAAPGVPANPPSLPWPLPFAGFGTSGSTACVGNDSRLSNARSPTSHAGSHNDDGSDPVTIDGGTQIESATVTDAQVAAANKDGSSGTASMRTLGTGASQACAGNDSRLNDSRAASSVSTSVLQTTTAALFGDLDFNAREQKNLKDPTTAQSSATRLYVDRPPIRDNGTTSTDTPTAADFGGVVRCGRIGALAITLPDLSAGVTSGKAHTILYVWADAGTNPTVTPTGAGVLLNESASAYAPGAAAGVLALTTMDGKRWYR